MHITNMIMRVACGVFLLLGALGASAQQLKLDVLKVGSQVYSNVVVLAGQRHRPVFPYEGGIKNVKLKYVSPEIQTALWLRCRCGPRKPSAANWKRKRSLTCRLSSPAAGARAISLPVSSEDNLVDPVSERSLLGKGGARGDGRRNGWVKNRTCRASAWFGVFDLVERAQPEIRSRLERSAQAVSGQIAGGGRGAAAGGSMGGDD